MKIKVGVVCGEKLKYQDKTIGYTIWIPFDDNDDAGLALDFGEEHIADMIAVLQAIQVAEPTEIKDEPSMPD